MFTRYKKYVWMLDDNLARINVYCMLVFFPILNQTFWAVLKKRTKEGVFSLPNFKCFFVRNHILKHEHSGLWRIYSKSLRVLTHTLYMYVYTFIFPGKPGFLGCNYLFSTFQKFEIYCNVIKFSICEFSILEKRDRRKRGESQQKKLKIL